MAHILNTEILIVFQLDYNSTVGTVEPNFWVFY